MNSTLPQRPPRFQQQHVLTLPTSSTSRRPTRGKVVYDIHAQFISFHARGDPLAPPLLWQGSLDRGSLKFRFRLREGGSVCLLLDDGLHELVIPLDGIASLRMSAPSSGNGSGTSAPEHEQQLPEPHHPHYERLLERRLSAGKSVFELGLIEGARMDFRRREPNRYVREAGPASDFTRGAVRLTGTIRIVVHSTVTEELATAMLSLVVRSLKGRNGQHRSPTSSPSSVAPPSALAATDDLIFIRSPVPTPTPAALPAHPYALAPSFPPTTPELDLRRLSVATTASTVSDDVPEPSSAWDAADAGFHPLWTPPLAPRTPPPPIRARLDDAPLPELGWSPGSVAESEEWESAVGGWGRGLERVSPEDLQSSGVWTGTKGYLLPFTEPCTPASLPLLPTSTGASFPFELSVDPFLRVPADGPTVPRTTFPLADDPFLISVSASAFLNTPAQPRTTFPLSPGLPFANVHHHHHTRTASTGALADGGAWIRGGARSSWAGAVGDGRPRAKKIAETALAGGWI